MFWKVTIQMVNNLFCSRIKKITMKPIKIIFTFLIFGLFYACSCDYDEVRSVSILFLDENSECYIPSNEIETAASLYSHIYTQDSLFTACPSFVNPYVQITPENGRQNIYLSEKLRTERVTLNPNAEESTFNFIAADGATNSLQLTYTVLEQYHRSCGNYHISFENIALGNHNFSAVIISDSQDWIAVYK